MDEWVTKWVKLMVIKWIQEWNNEYIWMNEPVNKLNVYRCLNEGQFPTYLINSLNIEAIEREKLCLDLSLLSLAKIAEEHSFPWLSPKPHA